MSFLIRIMVSFLTVAYIVRFTARIFEPGNAENAAVMSVLRQVFYYLDIILNVLKLPVDLVLNLISGVLPAAVKAWFPLTPVAGVLAKVVELLMFIPRLPDSDFGRQLMDANYQYMFPGVFDWSLLFAIGLWSLVAQIATDFFAHLERKRHHSRKQELERVMGEDIRQKTAGDPVTAGPILNEPADKNVLFKEVVKGLKSEINSLQSMVNLDPLTHLFNKGYLLEKLEREIGVAKLRNGCVGIVFIDIDDFKQLNDKHGHEFGDRVLAEAAKAISKLEPSHGKAIACRYGGEELVMLLLETSPEAAHKMGEAVREQIAGVFFPDNTKARITASVGVYTVRFVPTNGSHSMSAQDLLSKADAEMYKAKRNGKNAVRSSALP